MSPAGGAGPAPRDHEFALVLAHDVERPFKTARALSRAVGQRGRRRYHLRTSLPGENPYWQFGNLVALEEDLGVRSAFFFDGERGRGGYDPAEPDVADVIGELDSGGWEVGLSAAPGTDREGRRLADAKRRLERVLGGEVDGAWRPSSSEPTELRGPAAAGFRYVAGTRSRPVPGLRGHDGPLRPFDDGFVAFPATVVEAWLPDPGRWFHRAWRTLEPLLESARRRGAVVTAGWRQRYFSHGDYPGHLRLYRKLITRARELGAWIGAPGALYHEERLGAPHDVGDLTV